MPIKAGAPPLARSEGAACLGEILALFVPPQLKEA
jgi:hypothetical protein